MKEEQENKRFFKISEDLLNTILNFLADQKFKEVQHIVGAIQNEAQLIVGNVKNEDVD